MVGRRSVYVMGKAKQGGWHWDITVVGAIALTGVFVFFRVPSVGVEILGGALLLAVALLVFRGSQRSRAARTERLERENAALQGRLAEMEDRLANVETISRFEMRMAAREDGGRDPERRDGIDQ